MKENQKFRKLLDLKKIDIAILKDSEKSKIYGGEVTYDQGQTCWLPCEGSLICTNTCDPGICNTLHTCGITCDSYAYCSFITCG